MNESWIAERMRGIEVSGIRKVFDLAAKMTDPCNLSIGQPHFDTPEPIKQAIRTAIDQGKNAYSQSQGIAPLIGKLQAQIDAEYAQPDRKLFITSGTSGGAAPSASGAETPGLTLIKRLVTALERSSGGSGENKFKLAKMPAAATQRGLPSAKAWKQCIAPYLQ